MPPCYIGAAIKYAHTEAKALDFLGKVLDKGTPCVRLDKKTRNLITIIDINEI